MKSTLILSLGAVAAAQQSFPANINECGRGCITRLQASAIGFGCTGTADAACYCTEARFGYGLRDCGMEACGASQAQNIISYGIALCDSAVAGSGTPNAAIALSGGTVAASATSGSGSGSGSGATSSGSAAAGAGGAGASRTPITTETFTTRVSSDGSSITSTGTTTLYSTTGGSGSGASSSTTKGSSGGAGAGGSSSGNGTSGGGAGGSSGNSSSGAAGGSSGSGGSGSGAGSGSGSGSSSSSALAPIATAGSFIGAAAFGVAVLLL